MRKLSNILLFVYIFVGSQFLSASVSFGSRESTFNIGAGSNFHVGSSNLTIDGTLKLEKGSEVTGLPITFDAGLLESAGLEALMKGVYDPSTTYSIRLQGSGRFRAEPGTLINGLAVSGLGNRLEGQPLFDNPVILANGSTQLTLALQSQLNKNLVLNNGTAILDNDLGLADEVKILGDGTIELNNHRLTLGSVYGSAWTNNLHLNNAADLVLTGSLNLIGSWIFTGVNSINGNGCVLDLSLGGEIIVNNDSTLFINDVHITGLGDTAGKIILRNAGSQVRVANSTFKLDDNLTTSNGTFYVYGPSTFQLGPLNWTFDTGTGNIVVDGTTLWLDCLNSPLNRGKVYAPLAVPTTEANLEADLTSGHLSLLNRGTIKEAVDANFTFSGSVGPNPDEIIFDGNVSGTISLVKCVCVGKNQTIKITGNATLDGNGACIYFSTDPRAQLTVMPDTILTLSNICLCHMHQDVLDLRDRSRIKIGANVHWGLIDDITFTANAQIVVENTEQGANIFTLCGEAGRAMFNVRPEVPVFEDIFTYNRPNQTFRLGHNTLQLDSVGVSGMDYIYFYNDVDFSAAIALSGNSAADIDSRYTARQVYREDDVLTEPFITLIGQNDYGTAMNFFVEGTENDLILHKDGLILGGNVAFGDDPSNDLHVHMNASELYNPAVLSNEERAKARAAYETMLEARPNEQFPFVMFSGDPGMYLYSQDGLAHLDFFDRDAAAVIETTNSFEVDDNSLLTYNRLWLLYNPVKQYSRIFRASGAELIGEGLDPSFIRMPGRALSGNIAPSAIYKKRQYDKMMLVVHQRDSVHKVKQDKIDQYINAQPKQKKIAKSK
ncbi:MAG: hypothetical protein WCW33_06455, partial [Candidatus Babeliales bacterium]